MARGWESKAVESQVEAAERETPRRQRDHELTQAQSGVLRERNCILLSRTRILNDLQSAVHPRYREMLQRSLQFLDEKLAALDAAVSKRDLPE